MRAPKVPDFYGGPGIAETGTYRSRDLMTAAGANYLAGIIRDAWRSAGRDVAVWVEGPVGVTRPPKRGGQGPTDHRIYVVKVDLINGLPPATSIKATAERKAGPGYPPRPGQVS
jgi:hypothetical protein